jgi:hypothetical protein
MWIWRKNEDVPELLVAWSEFDTDANPGGFEEECQKQLDALKNEVYVTRYLTIKVDYRNVVAAFDDIKIEGAIVETSP